MAITNAHFNSVEKKAITVYQTTKAKGEWSEVVDFRPDVVLVDKVLKKFSVADLEKNYYSWQEAEKNAQEMYSQFILTYNNPELTSKEFVEEWRYYVSNRHAIRTMLADRDSQSMSLSIQNVLDINKDKKEDLFKLKLEVFEMEQVKESSDRQWKSRLRKATSALELFSELHSGLSGSLDESSESQD